LNILQDVPDVDNMLDIGCGEGTKTIQYTKMLSVPLDGIYGIEIKPNHVKIANDKLKIFNVNLECDVFPYPIVEYCAKYLPGFSSYTFYLLKKIEHNPSNCGWVLKSDVDTLF
jgi:ubiquinone/menaquinone biosynthesis C-methylase UbiE